jgi:hypothetical protein
MTVGCIGLYSGLVLPQQTAASVSVCLNSAFWLPLQRIASRRQILIRYGEGHPKCNTLGWKINVVEIDPLWRDIRSVRSQLAVM